MSTTESGVLSDQEILTFVFRPIGFLALIAIASSSLLTLFVETGALIVIGFGSHEDRGLSSFNAVIYVGKRTPRLVLLATHALLRLGIIIIPFLAGFWIVYSLLLSRYDINYYLNERPPSLWMAIFFAILLGLALAFLLLRLFAGWIVALPIVLFEDNPPREALRASRYLIGDQHGQVTIWLTFWIVSITLASAVLTAVIGFLGRMLIPEFASSLVYIAIGMGVVLVLSGLSNLVVSSTTTMLYSLLVARLYRNVSDSGTLQSIIAAMAAITSGQTRDERTVITARPILILGGSILAIIMVGGGLFLAKGAPAKPEKVDIIAHRGASGIAPENTMAAFKEAIRSGADWIEIDVQENAEGTIIVQHDSDFMRAAGIKTKTWNVTSDDLSKIDVGSWFDSQFADQRVPTLSEVLALAKGKTGVVIELKYYGHAKELETRVVNAVEAAEMMAEVSLMSLKYEGVKTARALRPEWNYGLLSTVSAGDLTHFDVNFLALNSAAATRSMIQHAHNRGKAIYVWTVNDPIQMSVMISRGVDGIITDQPALARKVMKERDELGAFGRLLVWIGGETGLLQVTKTVSTVDDA